MSIETPPYALHDEAAGTWYFRLPRETDGCGFHLNGEPQSVMVDGWPAHLVKGWVVATDNFAPTSPGRDSEVAATYSGGSELVGWRLREQFRGAALPETRTRDQMQELDEDGAEASAYEPVYEPRPPVVVRESGPRVLLDGAPLVEHPGHWVAELPYELREHDEFLHLFPGRLTGLWREAERRLEQIPGVSAFVDSSGYRIKFKVGLTVALPPEEQKPARGRRGNKTYRSAVTSRQIWREVSSSELPDVLPAPNLIEAVRLYQESLAPLVEWAAQARIGVVCSRCGGEGMVPAPDQPASVTSEGAS